MKIKTDPTRAPYQITVQDQMNLYYCQQALNVLGEMQSFALVATRAPNGEMYICFDRLSSLSETEKDHLRQALILCAKTQII